MTTDEERAKHAAYWREYYKDPDRREHRRMRSLAASRKRMADPIKGEERRAKDAESRRRYAEKPENQEAKRAYSKMRYALHKDEWLGRDLVFATTANTRAKQSGAEGRLSRKDVAAIQGPCAYCGTPDPNEWDHVIPMTRGGANHPANLVRCCRPCNLSKNNRTPEEWAEMKDRHRRIVELRSGGMLLREVAALTGVSVPAVSAIMRKSGRGA